MRGSREFVLLAGDAGSIVVGENSNLQDGVLVRSLRASPGSRNSGSVIGKNVTVGHGAVLHGVTIEDEAFIGIGSVLREGVKASYILPFAQAVPGLHSACDACEQF